MASGRGACVSGYLKAAKYGERKGLMNLKIVVGNPHLLSS